MHSLTSSSLALLMFPHRWLTHLILGQVLFNSSENSNPDLNIFGKNTNEQKNNFIGDDVFFASEDFSFQRRILQNHPKEQFKTESGERPDSIFWLKHFLFWRSKLRSLPNGQELPPCFFFFLLGRARSGSTNCPFTCWKGIGQPDPPSFDRISVSRLFPISGSAWRSLIFVCLNFSKSRTCLIGLWFHSPKWIQVA